MSAEPIRVVVADDHAPTRRDVRRILEADPRFDVVDEAADAAAAVNRAVALRPDVCLLDVNMPGSGVGAAWEISARLPETRIVMLTVSQEDRDLFAALQAGASGYLLKDMDAERLPHALADVLEGRAALPRELTARLVDRFRDRGARRRVAVSDGAYGTLTSREWQVLDLLRRERSTAEIARELTLSPVTVRTHVNSILRKVRAGSREELVSDFDAR